MTEAFATSQKERFRKLLLLAAESPFEGERAAALAAAERLATRFGMTLDEAAGAAAEPEPKARGRRAADADGADDWSGPRARRSAPEWMRQAATGYAYEASAAASRARQRHREQVEAAQRREEEERRQAQALHRKSGVRSERRMPARDFARTLIQQTGFSLREIGEITGLTQHELVGLKLKLRG
ncbi:Protein of unknown function [Tistlia consotensis]|uniref:DUF2786 domain-containing protein n=1 Tax=Tistlia consotensis USBA 355 TaxID=560819 RepID=A0A1Y6C1S9_9PROT|nr:DUF2786 domain-containing protein [Tistlia consotensis]SMF32077.1 Protein of unknown function [Tistlia consotensis USBA 355]SNR68082.1 Protein of unknown function [Tistlia consotensis]